MAVWHSITLSLLADKGLLACGVRSAERTELRELDDPGAPDLHCRIFAPHFPKLVSEPLGGEDSNRGRLTDSLGSFQHQHVIHLAARLKNARHGRDQKLLSD